MSELTHFDADGRAHMVDVGDKEETHRVALAGGRIRMRAATLAMVEAGTHEKGDVLGIARVAGIMAAKRTSELIPLCHPIGLTRVEVEFEVERGDARAAGATTGARTAGAPAADEASTDDVVADDTSADDTSADGESADDASADDASTDDAATSGDEEADGAVLCRVRAETRSRTGVEMEALIGLQVALATIYDMCKAVDRGMTMGDIGLLEKRGGKSGDWRAGDTGSTVA